MDEIKKRKAKRYFHLEKNVGNRFEIEKDTTMTKINGKTPTLSHNIAPNTKVSSSLNSNKMKRWWLVLGIIAIVVVLVYFLKNHNKSNKYQNEEIYSIEQVQEDPAVTSKKVITTSDNIDKNTIEEPIISTLPMENPTRTKPAQTNSLAEESVEKLAKEVWKGIYGNGVQRRKALGSNYEKVQARVNEMYRNGLVK